MFTQKLKTRYHAFGIHLLISALIALAIVFICLFLWYPGDLIKAGGLHGLTILLCVDLVLGPLLTLLVYKPNKPTLLFDLSCIGIFQIACLGIGLYFVYNEKPDIIVLADNGAHIISRADRQQFIDNSRYNDLKTEYSSNIPLVVAKIPLDDPQAVAPKVVFLEFQESMPFETITSNYYTKDEIQPETINQQLNVINNHLLYKDDKDQVAQLNNSKKSSEIAKKCIWTVVHSNHFDGHACVNSEKGITKLTK